MNQLKIGYDLNKTYFKYNILPNKVPTIFIHGVGLDNSMWFPQKKYFKNQSILFYDILNHGKSAKGYKKLNFNLFVNQLLDLIDNLNFQKVNLVGFSIGSLIAKFFTQYHFKKVNKLVLIGSVYNRSKDQIVMVKNRYQDALNNKESMTVETIKRWFNKDFLEKNKDINDFFYTLLERKKNKDFLPAYKLFSECDNYKINFKNFKMPCLIMTGENEIGSTPKMSDELSNEISNSLLKIIKKAKHGVTVEKAEEVNLLISKYLFN